MLESVDTFGIEAGLVEKFGPLQMGEVTVQRLFRHLGNGLK